MRGKIVTSGCARLKYLIVLQPVAWAVSRCPASRPPCFGPADLEAAPWLGSNSRCALQFLHPVVPAPNPQKQKSRRGGTPEGVRPRRLTRQQAPRPSRVALHLVVRRLGINVLAERFSGLFPFRWVLLYCAERGKQAGGGVGFAFRVMHTPYYWVDAHRVFFRFQRHAAVFGVNSCEYHAEQHDLRGIVDP